MRSPSESRRCSTRVNRSSTSGIVTLRTSPDERRMPPRMSPQHSRSRLPLRGFCFVRCFESLQFFHPLFQRQLRFDRTKALGAQTSVQYSRLAIPRPSLAFHLSPERWILFAQGFVPGQVAAQELLFENLHAARHLVELRQRARAFLRHHPPSDEGR